MSRAKRWCFTLNNPTEDETQFLQDYGDGGQFEYLVYGREVGESGTPHLQGYVIFNSAVRLNTVKNRLGSQRLHLEVSRGTPGQAAAYCKKDDDYDEFGDCPEVSQGKRTDLEQFFDWFEECCNDNGCPPTVQETCRAHPAIMTKFSRCYEVAVARWKPPPLVDGQLRDWQQSLVAGLGQPADDRKIQFVVDPQGGKGKSWLVQFLISHRDDVQFLSIGKRDDLAHAIQIQTKVFLVDVPRGQMEFLQYSVLEMLKNCLIFSPKYQSSMKRLIARPHVVVFSNEEPDYEKLTEDRYDVIQI